MVKVLPSLLAADFSILKEEVVNIEKAGADGLHLDVMDGHFVPNLTFGFPIISKLRGITNLPFDIHFMVTNPENYVQQCIDLGIEYVSVHQETTYHLHRLIYQLKDGGIKAGVVLNPATAVENIVPVLPDVDFVLLMSVNPGFGGQSFLPLVFDKLQFLTNYKKEKNLNFEIEIDGGVNDLIGKQLVEAGASMLVAGSYVFKSDDYSKKIRSLK